MSNAVAMNTERREASYMAQNGCQRLTVAQQRRIRKAERKSAARSKARTMKRLLGSAK